MTWNKTPYTDALVIFFLENDLLKCLDFVLHEWIKTKKIIPRHCNKYSCEVRHAHMCNEMNGAELDSWPMNKFNQNVTHSIDRCFFMFYATLGSSECVFQNNLTFKRHMKNNKKLWLCYFVYPAGRPVLECCKFYWRRQ